MRDPRDQEALADRGHFVVMLRLVAVGGRLLSGEVVDIETGPRVRFVGWPGLVPAVRSWLAEQAGQESADGRIVDPGPAWPEAPADDDER